MTERILVVEDEQTLRRNVARYLVGLGYEVDDVGCGSDVAPLLERHGYDIVLSDIVLGDMDGLQVLRHVRAVAPETAVLMMTAYGSLDSAIESFRAGAGDYLIKPFPLGVLETRIRNLIRYQDALRENSNLRAQIHRNASTMAIPSTSRAMARVIKQVERIASARCNVLILGESGTGKELVARIIHDYSTRAHGPFVPLNVAAIPENLLESTLFGHQRGAFTGADRSREGLFRAAAEGTLFLDEIAELPFPVQAKLLRALEEKEIIPLGSDKPIRVDTRVLVATHRDLDAMVRQGSFRQDLLFRLNAVEVRVPALRERREDIPHLVRQLIERHCSESARTTLGISEEALDLLVGNDWSKGNVRELSNAIEYAVIFCDGTCIDIDDLPERMREAGPGSGVNLEQATGEFEREYIASVLASVQGDPERAAQLLGVSRATVYRRMHGIRSVRPEAASPREPNHVRPSVLDSSSNSI